MTNPTADAIAALDHARGCVTSLTTKLDDRAWQPNRAFVEYARNELKAATYSLAALLSAQGQAGKPVAWRVSEAQHTGSDAPINGWHRYCDSENEGRLHAIGNKARVEPLYAQPQPAAGITDAEWRQAFAHWVKETWHTSNRFDVLAGTNVTIGALREIADMLLATITEKDDGHGRG